MDNQLGIVKLLKALERAIKVVLRKVDLDNSNLAKQISITYANDQVIVSAPKYIINLDRGRKKGSKRPPIKDIIEWIKDKNIKANGVTIEQLAFAVATSIGTEGIKGLHFIDDISRAVSKLVEDYFDKALTSKLKSI